MSPQSDKQSKEKKGSQDAKKSAVNARNFIKHLLESAEAESTDKETIDNTPELTAYLYQLIHSSNQQASNQDSQQQNKQKTANFDNLANYLNKSFSQSISKKDSTIVSLVDTIFNCVDEQHGINPQLVKVIHQIKIPFLVVALKDQEFFMHVDHPVRLLLDDMCKLALYWQAENPQTDIILEQINYCVQQIQSTIQESDDIVAVIKSIQQRFAIFSDNFLKKIGIFEKRIREAEEGKAKAEAARQWASLQIENLLQIAGIPEFVEKFFKDAWQHIIFLSRIKNDSEAVKQNIYTARLLLISLLPVNNVLQLEKFIELQPILIEQLNKDIDKSPFSHAEMQIFLQQLDEQHQIIIEQAKTNLEKAPNEEILRLKPMNPMQTETAAEATTETPAIQALQLPEVGEQITLQQWVELTFQQSSKSNDLSSLTFDETGNKKPPIKNLKLNRWLLIKQQNTVNNCKAIAYISLADKYIFTDTSGSKLAEYSSQQVKQMLQQKTLYELNSLPVVEQAIIAFKNTYEKKGNTQPVTNQSEFADKNSAEESATAGISSDHPETAGISQQQTQQQTRNLAAIKQQINQLAVGNWINLKIDNSFKKCKLAAKIASSGKYIFTNRSGIKVKEANFEKLLELYQLGEMMIDEQTPAFDQTLVSVIQSMRKSKIEKPL